MSRDEPIILGINAVYHESSAAIMVGSRLAGAVEEERLNRVKHGKKATIDGTVLLPVLAIDWCLEQAGVSLADVAAVGYSFSPRLRFEHNATAPDAADLPPGTYGSPSGERRLFELSRLTRRILERRHQVDLGGRFHFLPHHLCHLASAFFPSPHEDAAVLAIDGIGEWATTTLARGHGHELEILDEVSYPHSLGFLWERLTDYLGFRRNSDECKVMGLASYGDPVPFRSVFDRLVRCTDTGFEVDGDVLCFRHETDLTPLETLMGPRRLPHEPLAWQGADRRHADVAAALQEATERVILHLARRLADLTGLDTLCVAGGVGLNCVANGRLALESPFRDVWVQPAAHDAGTALGAAALLHHQVFERPRRITAFSPYLGPEASDEACRAAVDRFHLGDRVAADDGRPLAVRVAERLAAGRVVAWFQGRSEWGPRALGNRSILADPRNPAMRDILNERVKHRETFRPFCPSVLANHAPDWFDFGGRQPAGAAAYMLAAYRVLPERREQIPAVVHVDGTSRLQMVTPQSNPLFHELIAAFHARTGVPMLLNTSFNDREPIVCSPDDALRCFLSTRIDDLVLGPLLLDRQGA